MLDPRHLLQFLAVAEHRSFTKAAAELGVTQPGLTRNIKLMEARLGKTLLRRGYRKIQLTPLGIQVLEQAKQVEQSCRRVLSAVDNDNKGYIGEIRAGCTPTAAYYLLPQAIAEFAARQPQLRLDLRSSPTRMLEGALLNGQIDIEFGPPPPAVLAGRIEFTEFFRYRMRIVVGRAHRLARRRKITAAVLEQQKWIMHRYDTILRQMADHYLHALGVLSPAQTFELPSNMMVALLEQGEHVGVVPEFIFRDPHNRNKVIPLPVAQDDSWHSYGGNTLIDAAETPGLDNFIVFMRDRLAGNMEQA